jgi:hypothetical protein
VPGARPRSLLVVAALLASGGASGAALSYPSAKGEPIAGRWAFGGGIFEFVERPRGRFVSAVIRPRPGVACPAVNDKDGQIALVRRSARVYTGTWVWFATPSCRSAGAGATTITVAGDGSTATMVAKPPRGLEGRTLTLILTRPGAAASTTQLRGTVGPEFTITLADPQGQPVRSLRAGRYSFVIADRSPVHDFHLVGPGVDRVITSVPFVGQATFTATLRRGVYRFVCDPHAPAMNGSFEVV